MNLFLFIQYIVFRMRNDYNATLKKGKKIARAPPTIQKRKIDKPIFMPPVIIIPPFFVL